MQAQPHKKIILAIAGSSGSIYAKLLMDFLHSYTGDITVGVVKSTNGQVNWDIEIAEENIEARYPKFTFYGKQDFNAPFASGSAKYTAMVVCPSSMGVIGRIANGLSSDLMTRAADVIFKERRTLIVVPRETPLSLLHLRNLTTIAELGGTVIPAVPSFYSQPKTIEEAAMTVVSRIIDHLGLTQDTYRWGESE